MRAFILLITICFNSIIVFSQVVIPPRIQDVINITATSFMVIWSPASISGQPGAPFSYTLFVNGKGYNVGSALGLNVVGLTPSTTYTVSVMALNPQIGSIPGGNSAIVKTLCGIPSTIDISTDYTKQTNVSNVTVEAESRIRFINGFRFKAATNSRLITKFSSCPKSASLELDRLLPEGDFILKDTVDTLPIQRSIEEYSSETIVTLLDNIKLSPLPVKNMLSVSLGEV